MTSGEKRELDWVGSESNNFVKQSATQEEDADALPRVLAHANIALDAGKD